MRKKKSDTLDETMTNAVCVTVRNALDSILKQEYRISGSDGKERVDYEMTARMMKAQAKMALELLANLDKEK